METLTWEQAKQQVADRYRDNVESIEWLVPMYAKICDEAAELYAQAAANEAIKKDRIQIIERFPHPFLDENHQRMLNELPLPFPEEK